MALYHGHGGASAFLTHAIDSQAPLGADLSMNEPAAPEPQAALPASVSRPLTAPPKTTGPFLRLLPLWLLVVMLAVAGGLEIVRFHHLQWLPKTPLVLALLPLVRRR